EPLYEETIRTAKERGYRRVELDTRMEFADMHVEMGAIERAAAELAAIERELKPEDTLREAHFGYSSRMRALARGDARNARDRFAQSVELFDKWPAKISRNVFALIGLARAEQALGHGDAARTEAQRAITLSESFVEKGSPSYLIGLSRAQLGEIQLANHDAAAARASLASAVDHLQRTLGPNHPATVEARRLSQSLSSAS